MHSEVLYVGTHRRPHRDEPPDIAFGIYAFGKEGPADRLSALGMTEAAQPGWIAFHPSRRFLYAVNEVRNFGSVDVGGVSAYAIDPKSGMLKLLNARRTAPLPCHCEVDASGHYLLVATVGGGSVHLFPLASDGRLEPEADSHRHSGSSVHPRRQTSPHAHGIGIDRANRFVLVPDLGVDQLMVYELACQRGRLIPRPERSVHLPPGSGPRHVAFDSRARFVYLMNELSATITVFAYDSARGALRPIQTIDTLPDDFHGLRLGAEIAIHPARPYLYATTRSHGSSGEPPVRGLDTIVWFEIDEGHGTLRLRGRMPSGGEIPRTFTFDATGERLYVGHQCSGTIVSFEIDSTTGAPVATGEVVATPVPVCLRLLTMP